MKQITIILSIVVGLFAFAKADAQKSNERDQYFVQVDGLGCPFCAYGLEKKFKEFKGIKDVKIDIETGDFSFSYPASKPLSLKDVTNQVEKAGYTPKEASITRANGTTIRTAQMEKSQSMNLTTDQVFVNGKCGMCKARIEKAASDVPGVATATWDVKTKDLSVSYNPGTTSLNDIKKAAATAGHDTKTMKASDKTYESLPACCHYKREVQ